MGYVGVQRLEVAQEFVKVIPQNDPDLIDYKNFKATFGADANAFLIAVEAPDWFTKTRINALFELTQQLRSIKDVKQVMSLTNITRMELDTVEDQLRMVPLMKAPIISAEELLIFKKAVLELPFYDRLVFSENRQTTVIAVTVTDMTLISKRKHQLAQEITAFTDKFAQEQQLKIHYAGLPFIRTYITRKLPKEMAVFVALALLLTVISLFLFYRSVYAMLFPLFLLIICACWTLGIIGLLGYKVTILTALLPPIIIILGIPPSIYMLSEYHEEYRKTGNKQQALSEMIKKMGLVTLMINANTAFGFLTLYFTEVVILQEFGLVAFLGTMAAYFITIVLLPGFFSLLPPPSEKNLRYLEAPVIKRMVRWVESTVRFQRKYIYIISIGLLLLAGYGITQLQAVSYMIDDLPTRDHIYTDLRFMEQEFNGVMPFEIVIDSRKKGGIQKFSMLKKIDALQTLLKKYPELSRTVSIVDGLKWSRQAVFGGERAAYAFPAREEMDFLLKYAARKNPNSGTQNTILQVLVDSTARKARITAFVKDIGSREMPILIVKIRRDLETVFSTGSKPEISMTGTTRIFLKSNQYLIENLVWSLLATFIIIGLQMYVLFGSFRIMAISMIPNLIPLVVTAGIMGFLSIPVKPSTALIYELAFGIAIDSSIHYLAAYRFIRRKNHTIAESVRLSILSTGMSIIFTSIVLFVGFVIFAPSAFGSTRALGILTSVTLFIAMFSNLFLMPAMVLDFDRERTISDHALIDES